MSAIKLQFDREIVRDVCNPVASALTSYNRAVKRTDFYYFDDINKVNVSLLSSLAEVKEAIKKRIAKHPIADSTNDETSEDATERNLRERFLDHVETDEQLKKFVWYWLLRPLSEMVKNDKSLVNDIERIVVEFLRKHKAYFSEISEYDICLYLTGNVDFEKTCFNCGQTIVGKGIDYTCTCGAKHIEKRDFLDKLEQIKLDFNALVSIYSIAISCLDYAELIGKFNEFTILRNNFENRVRILQTAHFYYDKNSWFIQNDPLNTLVKYANELANQKSSIAKKAEAAKRGEFVCWDGSMIPLINLFYAAFLDNADKVCDFIESYLSGRDKIRFKNLLSNLQLSNQKLFLAQLFMPNCQSRSEEYKLIYWIGTTKKGTTIEIKFEDKNNIELFAMFEPLVTTLFMEHANQLLVLEQSLLDVAIDKLNIDVNDSTRVDIREGADTWR